MQSSDIRATQDSVLFESLKQDPFVSSILKKISQHEQPLGIRRQFLGTAVRLTKNMSPKLIEMVQHCKKQLDINIETELYVFAAPQYNAMCIKPENGRLMIAFTSSILKDFSLPELQFVLGHEFGHYKFGHHDIPVSYIMKAKPDPRLVLTLFTWSRYAEISADRAGALCCGDFEATANAMFKLSAGISNDLVRFHLEDFISQVEDMKTAMEKDIRQRMHRDWFSTHPFSPLRVQALQKAFESVLLESEGISKAQLEIDIEPFMNVMQQSYLDSQTDVAELMRRVLFAGSFKVALATGTFNQKEQHVFEKLLGEGRYGEQLDQARILSDLDERIEDLNQHGTLVQKSQVLRDLALIAVADNKVTKKERHALRDIGQALQIPVDIIEVVIQRRPMLD